MPPEKRPTGDAGKGHDDDDDDRKEYRAGNCNDCNRQFCLDYNLPICKGAGMEDVFTTCFREFLSACWGGRGFIADVRVGVERDSRKDEAVVFIFIAATAGLLVWAAIKPWVGRWVDVSSYGTTCVGIIADNLAL